MSKWDLVERFYEISDNDVIPYCYLAEDTVGLGHQRWLRLAVLSDNTKGSDESAATIRFPNKK